jgi:phosphoribosyl 1,2-cyclic phosphodiesterase
MELSFCSFASGSSGNCYLVKSARAGILIDAGISTKRIHTAIDEIGISRSDIDAVFITHEHSDHVKGIKVLTKQNPSWRVYASRGTGDCIRESVHRAEQLICFDAGDVLEIGDMKVKSLGISHDAADPVSYSITCGDSKLTILTDTGYVPAAAADELVDSDIIILEANHEVNMLKAGPYPYNLKLRILGERGHLSNEAAGDILTSVMRADARYRKIFLAHLSKENNFPSLAKQTVSNMLEEQGFLAEKHFDLEVLCREEISGVTEI